MDIQPKVAILSVNVELAPEEALEILTDPRPFQAQMRDILCAAGVEVPPASNGRGKRTGRPKASTRGRKAIRRRRSRAASPDTDGAIETSSAADGVDA